MTMFKNKSAKTRLSLLVSLLLLLQPFGVSAFATTFSQGDVPLQFAPQKGWENVDEEVLDYTYQGADADLEYAPEFLQSGSLPTVYNPATISDGSFYIQGWPIQNQGQEGNCWAYAATASHEAWMKKTYGTYPKYSEFHMAGTLYRNNNETLPWTFNTDEQKGGNRDLAAAYFARGSGPVLLSSFTTEDYHDKYLNASHANYYDFSYINGFSAQHQPTSALYLTGNGSFTRDSETSIWSYNGDNIPIIKQAILDYGAVMTSYYAKESDANYFNSQTGSYCYCPDLSSLTNLSSNHAVTIVGWDDNYSASNFSNLPNGVDGLPSDKKGAWIVRNSWGANGSLYAHDGYEYISYYDALIGSRAAVFVGKTDSCNFINQYDGVYPNSTLSLPEHPLGRSFLNRYTTTAPQEIVKGIGVFIAHAGTKLRFQIDDTMESLIPDSNGCIATQIDYNVVADSTNQIYSVDQEGITFPHPGYYYITLKEPITVKGSYGVVMNFVNNPAQYSVPVVWNINWTSSNALYNMLTNYVREGSWYVHTANASTTTWASAFDNSVPFHLPIKTYTDATDIVSIQNVSSSPKGDGHTLTVNLNLYDSETTNGKMALLGVYSADGTLCGFGKKLLGNTNQDTVTADYVTGATYRVFLWDSLSGLKPLWTIDSAAPLP